MGAEGMEGTDGGPLCGGGPPGPAPTNQGVPMSTQPTTRRVQRIAAHATYDAVMRRVRPALLARLGASPRAHDTVAVVAEAISEGVHATLGHPGKLTASWAQRQEAMERILDAAEHQARDQIVYLPGPRIEHDDPRLKRWADEGRALQADIALVSDRCFAVLHHGPGHQSTVRCELRGPHHRHQAEVRGGIAQWVEQDDSTDIFDNPPDPDEEY